MNNEIKEDDNGFTQPPTKDASYVSMRRNDAGEIELVVLSPENAGSYWAYKAQIGPYGVRDIGSSTLSSRTESEKFLCRSLLAQAKQIYGLLRSQKLGEK